MLSYSLFFQSGWGKRFAVDDDYNLQHYASLLEQQNEQQQNEPRYFDYEPYEQDFEPEKRAWKSDALRGAWGKRANQWTRFRGNNRPISYNQLY